VDPNPIRLDVLMTRVNLAIETHVGRISLGNKSRNQDEALYTKDCPRLPANHKKPRAGHETDSPCIPEKEPTPLTP
jgi:hypothetical protein